MVSKKISIIIAAFNEASNLEQLIKNIRAQSCSDVEILIMDGGSRDGTEKLLEQHDEQIDFWKSKTDSGIYQAWNEGLSHATGDYICFMGADDRWASTDSLRRMVALAENGIDLVCAKFKVTWPGGQNYMVAGDPWVWAELKRTMNLSHRGLLHHCSLFEKYGLFNENFMIAGDYEFLLRCGKNLKTIFLDEVTILAGADGVSFRRPYISLKERFLAQRIHHSIPLSEAAELFLQDYSRIQGPRVKGKIKKIIFGKTKEQ